MIDQVVDDLASFANELLASRLLPFVDQRVIDGLVPCLVVGVH